MAKYRYSRSTSPFDEAKGTYIMIGVCAVVVIAALILCLTLQNGGTDPEDIPVVEQGDGDEGLSGYNPEGVTSMGDIIIDDGGAPVDEFTVSVSGADGLYRRDDASSLTISGQNAESFSFELNVGGSGLGGSAYFTGERSAVCEKAEGILLFDFDAGAVYVTAQGAFAELGEASAEGLYALIEAAPTTSASDAPTTTTTSAAQATAKGTYDLDIIKSDSTQSALSGIMSKSDYNLTKELLDAQGGYGMIYGTGDSSKEKSGRDFNYDPETDAVMYCSFESGTGREVIVLCAADGKVYAGVCDGSEYRYYTNDQARAGGDKAPDVIKKYAEFKKMTLNAQ